MEENTNIEDGGLAQVPDTVPGKTVAENIPALEPENPVPIQESENMEVHHHPDLHHKRKDFKEYFFEFLMIFFAVTAGFVAENIREHYVETNREMEYIHSVSEDLKQDIYTLDSIIAVRENKSIMLDSLLYLLNEPDPNQHGNDIYYYARWSPRTYRFYSHDRTILQLKNSGNWRLIHKTAVSNALQVYDELVRSLTVYIEQREESVILIMYASINRLFDNRVFNSMVNGLNFERPVNNPHLLSSDKAILNEFANQVHFVKNTNIYFINTSVTLLTEAKKTLALINKEYDLK